jgi:DNA-binding CsgD family transcriptional regulator
VSNRERGDEAIASCHRAQQKVHDALHCAAVIFSHHDREVLRRVARGASIKQIADELDVAVGTVTSHVRNLCAKAGVQSHEQLLVFAMQQPQALRPGVECRRGIHLCDPACPCPHCRALLAA